MGDQFQLNYSKSLHRAIQSHQGGDIKDYTEGYVKIECPDKFWLKLTLQVYTINEWYIMKCVSINAQPYLIYNLTNLVDILLGKCTTLMQPWSSPDAMVDSVRLIKLYMASLKNYNILEHKTHILWMINYQN